MRCATLYVRQYGVGICAAREASQNCDSVRWDLAVSETGCIRLDKGLAFNLPTQRSLESRCRKDRGRCPWARERYLSQYCRRAQVGSGRQDYRERENANQCHFAHASYQAVGSSLRWPRFGVNGSPLSPDCLLSFRGRDDQWPVTGSLGRCHG